MIDPPTRKRLLSLARTAIGLHLQGADIELPERFDDPVYAMQHGVFVRIFRNGDLRGGFGSYSPLLPVAQGVVEYTVSAAFGDPRFAPIEESEFDDLVIELQIASLPEILSWESPADLFAQLVPGEDGIALEYDAHASNFLPQVWEVLPVPAAFLAELAQKAGLPPRGWEQATIKRYQVERFAEDDFSDAGA